MRNIIKIHYIATMFENFLNNFICNLILYNNANLIFLLYEDIF